MSRLDEIYDRINDDLEVINSVKTEDSNVLKFYSGKTLFITGVTGFMGKSLLEKLLRTCTGIKRIYILLRPKGCETVEERLRKYFQHEVFDLLRKINPNFEKKVVAIKGDLFLDGLGLSKEDRDVLIKETNIILHNAANVKFTARVHVLLKVNVIGTKNLFDIAEDCHNLELFMYISSAYSHIYRKIIKEEFYQPAADLSTIYNIVDVDEKTENGLSEESVKTFIGDQFNVYTFSKAAAEELVKQRSIKAKFACGVYRPSIVISTIKEPIIGWVGNGNGPLLLFTMVGLGLFHAGYYINKPVDLIPCDYAINALLVITPDVSNRWNREQKAVIYNYGSSTVNPISLPDIYYNAKEVIRPSERSKRAVWVDYLVMTNKFWVFMTLHFLLHFIPACIADTVLLLCGKKPKALSLFWKGTKNYKKILYLANGDWKIYMTETLKVIDRLNTTDKELFSCDVREINWESYPIILWRGIKKYVLKEPVTSLDSERRYNLLWYAHYGVISLLILALTYCTWRLILWVM